jgi:hypothetical protein
MDFIFSFSRKTDTIGSEEMATVARRFGMALTLVRGKASISDQLPASDAKEAAAVPR